MKVSEVVTKTDYPQSDNARGFYTRIPKEKIEGLGFPNLHREILIAIGRCFKVINSDKYIADKAYFRFLKGGDISVNVVCTPLPESEGYEVEGL